MRAVLKLAVAPLLLLIAGAAVWLAIREGWNREALLAAALLFTLLYLTAFEALIPLDPEWRVTREDAWPDVAHLVLVNAFSGVGAVAALSLVLWLQRTFGLEAAFWREIPVPIQAALAMIVGEFLPYWYHRFSHASRFFFWRVHSIHHITPRLNSLKGSWMHPVNTFLNAFTKMLPILLLGFGEETLVTVSVFSLVIGYMSHANIDARTGFLDYLIATPHVHHFHHSVRPEESRNYGTNVILWDLLFGTYFNAKGRVGEVGIQPAPGTLYPPTASVARQLRYPFQRRAGREALP